MIVVSKGITTLERSRFILNYADLLSSYISKSNMSLTQITDALKEKGYSSHKGYISKLQNGKLPPAGDDLNRALAEVTGGDPQKLIWAAHLEKIPKDMKEFFISFDGSVIENAVELEKKFPGFLRGQFGVSPEIEKSKEFQEFINHMEFWGFNYFDFMDQPGNKIKIEKGELVSNEAILYKSFFNTAKRTLDLCYSSSVDQVEIRSSILMAFTAFEIRLNEVLLKVIQMNGTSAEVGMNYLKDLPLNTKLRNPLEQHLGYDISKEPFSLDLWGCIDLNNKIAFNEVHEKLTRDKADYVLSTIDAAIDSLNRHAKQKGIN
jgi:hypothetical protein